jgi:hypothetical protein
MYNIFNESITRFIAAKISKVEQDSWAFVISNIEIRFIILKLSGGW